MLGCSRMAVLRLSYQGVALPVFPRLISRGLIEAWRQNQETVASRFLSAAN